MSTNNPAQQLSPTVQTAQKAVVQNKQTVSIRKVTIQSITPVINKVEEHISYLMEETSNLRRENGNLKKAMASQQVLEEQVHTIHKTLESHTSDINTFNRDKQIKLLRHDQQLSQIKNKIVMLKQESIVRDNRIDEINKNNENYLEQIKLNKEDQFQAIEKLRQNIQNYYQEEVVKINGTNTELDYLRNKILVMEEERQRDQKQVQKVTNITSLYQSQREDIKKVIDKTSFLENNVVMITDYDRYKRHNKVQLQLVKTDVRKMIDEALTPEIRRFLPQLIKKLDDLNRFEGKLDLLYKEVQKLKKEHQDRMDKMQEQWNARFVKTNSTNTEEFLAIKSMISAEVVRMDEKREEVADAAKERMDRLVEEMGENKMVAEQNLKEEIRKLDQDLRQHIIVFGDTLIQEKKSQIYAVMETAKPQEKAQQQAKMFQAVNNIEPLVNQVKRMLEESKLEQKQFKKQQLESRDTLNQKILLFSNQIVKVKSDFAVQKNQNKKILQSFGKKLNINNQTNIELSQLTSKVMESVILMYALSLDAQFMGKDQEFYVTYNDGILLDVVQGQTNVKYRRKNMNPELAKRAVLNSFIKVIDEIVLKQPNLGWNRAELKPSHFFTSINESYIELFEEYSKNLRSIDQETKLESKRALSSERQNKLAKFTSTQLNMPKIVNPHKKQNSTLDPMSKTIDFSSNEFTYSPKRMRYNKDEQSQGLNQNRKSIRLKKVDKKQP